MDIVSRLKTFMDENQIANSQLADKCNIPRPTVSQILNGRNKKISDELIGKIHAAYPDLSILWLMFGEGRMTVDSNIEISEPKNAPQVSFLDSHTTLKQTFTENSDLFSPFLQKTPENSSAETDDEFPSNTHDEFLQESQEPENSNKRIRSIVVFYEDNTFQTFDPS